MTHYTLDDIGGALSWRALRNFVRHVGHDTALWRELHPETAEQDAWEQGRMDAWLLADVYDAVMGLKAQVVASAGARPRRTSPHHRPGDRQRETTRIGSAPVPVRDFDSWWDEHIRG